MSNKYKPHRRKEEGGARIKGLITKLGEFDDEPDHPYDRKDIREYADVVDRIIPAKGSFSTREIRLKLEKKKQYNDRRLGIVLEYLVHRDRLYCRPGYPVDRYTKEAPPVRRIKQVVKRNPVEAPVLI